MHFKIFCPFSKERQGEGRRMLEYMVRRRGAKLWETGGGNSPELAFDRKKGHLMGDTGEVWAQERKGLISSHSHQPGTGTA